MRRYSWPGATALFLAALNLSGNLWSAETIKPNDYALSAFKVPQKITPYTLPENWPIHFDRAVVNLAPKDAKSKVVVIGTGNPIPNPYRNGPALAVVVNEYPYFVDAGEGIWRGIANAVLWQGEDLQYSFLPNKLKYLFVTHLHEDHTIGIPSFIFNPYKFHSTTDKHIFGPPGTGDMVDHIVAAWKQDVREMMTSHKWQADGSRAKTTEVSENGVIYQDDNVKVEAFRTLHGAFEYSLAYRFTTPDRVFTFGGDGIYSGGLVEAARGADILFIEAVTEEQIQHAPWGGKTVEEKKKRIFSYHIPPRDLIRVKEESGVKSIVLIHEQYYSKPEDYYREALLDEIKRAGMKGPIYSSIDGDIY
jgi:ribonuclease BN (tRNA processing enzyme)